MAHSVGYITYTVPSDLDGPAGRIAFERMHAAAMYTGAPHVFATPAGEVSVVMGYAPATPSGAQGSYEVTLSATGEIFSGLDLDVPAGRPSRDRDAALAVLDAIARVEGNAALRAYVASQSPVWLLP